jgi:transcriptional regulator with XRE-family HTH domain
MSVTEGWIPDDSTLGARLALVRQRMGWNIKEAAIACAIAPESWRRWEADRTEPRGLSTYMKIAGVTGVNYRWLAFGPKGQPVKIDQSASATRRYPVGPRLVATIMAPFGGRPDARTVRTRPIEDRQLSIGQ